MGCFSGPKTTTTSTNTQRGATTSQEQQQQSGSNTQQSTGQTNTNATSTTNPNLPDWLLPFKQGLAQQYGNLYSQFGQMAQHPLYGAAQQANFQEQLNRQLGGAQQGLMSSLAQRGALNSGNAAQAQTGLAMGGVNSLQNYLAQVPLLNAQNQQGALGAQAGVLNGASNLSVPYGQTTTSNSTQDMINNILSQFSNNSSGTSSGTSDQSGSGTQTQQTSGGMLQSILGGLINAGLGAATGGLSSLFGGGSKGGGASNGYGSGGPGMTNLPSMNYTSPFQWGIPTPGNGGGLPGGSY